MKHTIALSFVLLLLLPATVAAATPTASPSGAKKAQVNTKIEDLKERLATKVAELRKTSPKAISGTVTQVSVSTITVDTPGKAVKIELTDDISVYQILKGKKTKLTIDSVEKNDPVTVFGDYDATLDILQAKTIFIEATTEPSRIHGRVSSVDSKKNVVMLKGVDGETYTIDVETTTKTAAWNKEKGIEKSGFSKIEPGAFLSVLGTENTKKPGEYIASRILFFVDGSQTPTPTLTVTPTASPSSATRKTTPTKNISPTPSRRVTPTPVEEE